MTKRTRPTYSPEFRLEVAQLVVDQKYTAAEAAQAIGVSKSAMDKWVRQLNQERQGTLSKASPMTPEQIEIRELKKQNDILKTAHCLAQPHHIRNTLLAIL